MTFHATCTYCGQPIESPTANEKDIWRARAPRRNTYCLDASGARTEQRHAPMPGTIRRSG